MAPKKRKWRLTAIFYSICPCTFLGKRLALFKDGVVQDVYFVTVSSSSTLSKIHGLQGFRQWKTSIPKLTSNMCLNQPLKLGSKITVNIHANEAST